MKSKISVLMGCILCVVAILGIPSATKAQVPAEITQMYKACTDSGGKAASDYQTWVKQNGCICPGSSVGSGQRTCSTGAGTGSSTIATLPGLTSQQQLGMQIGTLGANMVGQGLRQLLTGPPVDPVQKQLHADAQLLNNSGIYLLRQKNYAGAINEFQQALAKTPNDSVIANNLTLAKNLQARARKNAAEASQTSAALGQLLGGTSAGEGNVISGQGTAIPNGSALNLVNLETGTNTVDLRGTTKTYVDPSTLKNDSGNSSAQPTDNAKAVKSLDDILGGASDQDTRKQLEDFAADHQAQKPQSGGAANSADSQGESQNLKTDGAQATKATDQAIGQNQGADTPHSGDAGGAGNTAGAKAAGPQSQQPGSHILDGAGAPDFDGRTTGNAPLGKANVNSVKTDTNVVDMRGTNSTAVDPARVVGSSAPAATINSSTADKALMKFQWETSIDPRYKNDPEVQQRIRDLWTAARLRDAEADKKLQGILADQFKASGQSPQQIADFFANFSAIATGDGPSPKEWSKASPLANEMDSVSGPAITGALPNYYGQLMKDIGKAEAVKADVSYMASGPQTEDDCVLYAIANGAHVPEKQVKTEFTNIVRNLGMDPIAERTSPESVVAIPEQGGRGGLDPAEELLVAEKFGKVIPVPDGSYAKAIASTKQPVITTIQIKGGQHKVVVTGVYRTADGKIYYSVMDSNLGPDYKNSTAYVEKSSFEARLTSGGFVVMPAVNP